MRKSRLAMNLNGKIGMPMTLAKPKNFINAAMHWVALDAVLGCGLCCGGINFGRPLKNSLSFTTPSNKIHKKGNCLVGQKRLWLYNHDSKFR
jgi:hypothetical protein